MARESHLFGGLQLNGGDYRVIAHSFRPAQEDPDWITSRDSEGAVLLEPPRPQLMRHTIKVRVVQQPTADAAQGLIAAIVDRLGECVLQPGGLPWLWTPQDTTTPYTGFVLHGQVSEVPIELTGDDAGWLLRSPVVVLDLAFAPFWQGAEIVNAVSVTSSLPAFTLTVEDVPGDIPALGRLIVTDAAAKARRHLEWGGESRYMNPALGLLLDSDSLSLTGCVGTQTTLSGAYDPGASGNSIITATLVAQPQAVCATGPQAHIGSFRVKARVHASSLNVRLRLAYRAGDNPFGETDVGYVPPVVEDGFCEVDLGVITVAPAVLGTQVWEGRLDAYGAIGDVLYVDYFVLVPLERYGKARGIYTYQPGMLVARDEFAGATAGSDLHGRTPPLVGAGTWQTAGAATDFKFADGPGAGETITRATVSDSDVRTAELGSTSHTDVEFGFDFRFTALASGYLCGAWVRYVDASNYAQILVIHDVPAWRVLVLRTVAGASTAPLQVNMPAALAVDTWHRFRAVVFASGAGNLTLLDPATGAVTGRWFFSDPALGTGGALASGKCRLVDFHFGAACARYYDNVYAATPPDEEVLIYPGRSLEIRWDGVFRENAAGGTWGRPWYRGAHLLVPQSGSEGRATRFLIKARRNDIDVTGDPDIADSTTAQLNLIPRYRMPRGPM